MIRRRDPDSSLELLLDTMCNTFGGVIFIAITLVVIMAMSRQIRDFESTTQPVISVDAESLAAAITQEEEEVALLEYLLKQQNSEADTTERESLKSYSEKLAQNQQKLAEVISQKKNLESENNHQRTQVNNLNIELSNLKKSVTLLQESIAQNTETLHKNQELPKPSPFKMNFKILKISAKQPFFLLMDNNHIWKLGPYLENNDIRPDSDVTYRQRGAVYYCQIATAKPGVPMIDASGNLTREFRKLLQDIPKDRVPYFSITPNAAPFFSQGREKLKEENLLHGCDTLYKSGEEFHFQLTDKIDHYEY